MNEIADTVPSGKHPLVVTSYFGRNPNAFLLLVKLAHRLAVAVQESCPSAMNFPNPAASAEADVVVVMDSDEPWLPKDNKPAQGATIFDLDADSLKMSMPFL